MMGFLLEVTLFAVVALICAFQGLALPDEDERVTVTHQVYFDISIGGVESGRIVFGLFGDLCPKTVSNFLHLSNHTYGKGYRGSTFHRTIRNFMIQGGDYVSGNGFGEDSIWDGLFADENFILSHYGAGWLGMANRGKDTNGCQFYICLVVTPWLDGEHTLFGVVLEGMDVVKQIELNPTESNSCHADKPKKQVAIRDSGLLHVPQKFDVLKEPVTGTRIPDDKRFYHQVAPATKQKSQLLNKIKNNYVKKP